MVEPGMGWANPCDGSLPHADGAGQPEASLPRRYDLVPTGTSSTTGQTPLTPVPLPDPARGGGGDNDRGARVGDPASDRRRSTHFNPAAPLPLTTETRPLIVRHAAEPDAGPAPAPAPAAAHPGPGTPRLGVPSTLASLAAARAPRPCRALGGEKLLFPRQPPMFLLTLPLVQSVCPPYTSPLRRCGDLGHTSHI